MTTQPKLPEWVEALLKQKRISAKNLMGLQEPVFGETDVRLIASRLLAEIVPEGYCIVPIESRESDGDNPGPAAEPCKNPNCKGGMLRVGENAWAYCPDCNCTETKVDSPGHADYVAGKKEEGGGKS